MRALLCSLLLLLGDCWVVGVAVAAVVVAAVVVVAVVVAVVVRWLLVVKMWLWLLGDCCC